MKNILRKSLYIILMVTMIITSFTPYNTKADITYSGDYLPIIDGKGGTTTKEEDGVSISKTIIRNDKENYFDIKLTVETQEVIEKIQLPPADMSIVLVIDNSLSMRNCMNSSNRCDNNKIDNDTRMENLKIALNGENGFLDKFIDAADKALDPNQGGDPNTIRELAIVNFSDSAQIKLNFENGNSKYTSENSTTYKSTIYNNYIKGLEPSMYTNTQDGLKKAKALLDNAHTKNKYIILLTDGYPTRDNEGSTLNATYSNGAAINARIQAEENAKAGITTYVIGVGLNGQPNLTYNNHEVGYHFGDQDVKETVCTYLPYNEGISKKDGVLIVDTDNNILEIDNIQKWKLTNNNGNQYYVNQYDNNNKGIQVNNNRTISLGTGNRKLFNITNNGDNSFNLSYKVSSGWNSTTYYLRSSSVSTTKTNLKFASECHEVTTKNKIVTYEDFERWLGGRAFDGDTASSPARGISNIRISDDWLKGGYIPANDQEALSKAYTKIFETIEEEVQHKRALAWTVNDPMNLSIEQSDGSFKMGNDIEFVNFYEYIRGGYNSEGDLIKTSSLTTGNKAIYDSKTKSFEWDLKNSLPVSHDDETNISKYELIYRVRLVNENVDFDSTKTYETNGTTILYYVNTINGSDVGGTLKQIEFLIPQVRGYQGNYEFTKKSSYYEKELSLSGAVFKLIPRTEGFNKDTYFDGESNYISKEYSLYSTYDEESKKYKFTNIPSGYEYSVYEVQAPEGYEEYTEENPLYIGTISVLENKVRSNIKNDTVINNPIMTELQIQKIIDSQTGNVDENQEFTFSVTFKGNKSKDETFSVIGYRNKTSIKSNEKFKLKHNETITILVPYGIDYKVVEDDPKNVGYTIVSGNNSEGTIKDNTISVVIHNKRQDITVKANKVWENVKDYTSLPDIKFTLKRYVNGEEVKNSSVERTVRSTINNGSITTTCYDGNTIQGSTCKWENLSGDYEYKVEETITGEDADVFSKEISKSVNGNEWTFTITNTDTRIVVLPEAGSSGGLILASLAFVFITMPVMYTAYNLYIEKRWF